MSEHDPRCQWEQGGPPCLRFSTDGTRLGADIAHTMGTTDEDAIRAMTANDIANAAKQGLTGMEEEQRDWDADQG